MFDAMITCHVTVGHKKVSEYAYDLGIKSLGQMFLKFVLFETRTSLLLFDVACSYLAQWMLMLRRLQQRFQFEWKVNVTYT